MKYGLLIMVLLMTTSIANAQSVGNDSLIMPNTANRMLDDTKNSRVMYGLYGQLDYTQPIESGVRHNGKMDIHRMVGLMGINFSDKTTFITEVEMEHAKEIYVEQAFVNHQISNGLNFRAGLMLVPMGIVNEYHEPTTFNGVTRPASDNKVVPTTWREGGIGIGGNIQDLGFRYQLYAFTPLASYVGGNGKLSGGGGIRGGRLKGSKVMVNTPAISAKVEHYAIQGLKIGLSGYYGTTTSDLFSNLDQSNAALMAQADSSVINMMMIGGDARYTNKAFRASAQYIMASYDNTIAYNQFTGTDMGNSVSAFYVDASWNVTYNSKKANALRLFTRFEQYDLHQSVTPEMTKNPSYKAQIVTSGFSYELAEQIQLKMDYAISWDGAGKRRADQLNAGIGFWFY